MSMFQASAGIVINTDHVGYVVVNDVTHDEGLEGWEVLYALPNAPRDGPSGLVFNFKTQDGALDHMEAFVKCHHKYDPPFLKTSTKS